MRIGVIIPIYNTPIKYWEACHRSIMSQGHAPDKYFAVDDGSKLSYDWITERLPHKGMPHNLNYAINKIIDCVEIITYIGSDDWISPDFCETIIKTFESDPELMLVNFWLELSTGGVMKSPYTHAVRTVIYKKEGLYKDIFPGEDKEFFERITSRYKWKTIEKVLYNYRRYAKGTP